MKVFGLGLSKTGTKTLGACLRTLGFNHFGWDRGFTRSFLAGDTALVDAVVRDHESFDDLPWPLLYRHVDRTCPDARFVLTVRRDSETWYRSLLRHSEYMGPSRIREQVYGHAMPHGRRGEFIDYYERHNREVVDYFHDRPGKLLVACWELEPSWEPLCTFLDRPLPEEPFPHRNQRRARTFDQYARRLRHTTSAYARRLIERD